MVTLRAGVEIKAVDDARRLYRQNMKVSHAAPMRGVF